MRVDEMIGGVWWSRSARDESEYEEHLSVESWYEFKVLHVIERVQSGGCRLVLHHITGK